MIYCSIIVYKKEKEVGFMETDKGMTEILQQDFSVLNENNKKKVIDMTKFLVLTQNTIVPGFLEENSPVDMSSTGTEKERRKVSI
jgi:hypothetical protein